MSAPFLNTLHGVREDLRARMARFIDVPESQIDLALPLSAYGVDSLLSARLIADFGRATGRALNFADFHDAESLAAIADLIAASFQTTIETN